MARRAGQSKGGELIAIAMAGALLFFVGREVVRTPRVRHALEQSPAVTNVDTAAPATVVQSGQPVAPTTSRELSAGRLAKLDVAEIRKRIELGAPGTYMLDMLADGDSLLTRWPDRQMDPVRVWVERSSTVPDWSPDFARVANEAFAEWGTVGLPLRFSFTVDSSTADIHITFADRFPEKNRLGVTTHHYDSEGWIARAEIVIALHDSAGAILPPSVISATARHEIGHALGLAHSKDRATIMYPESHTLSISAPDRATVKLLYTLPPGSVK